MDISKSIRFLAVQIQKKTEFLRCLILFLTFPFIEQTFIFFLKLLSDFRSIQIIPEKFSIRCIQIFRNPAFLLIQINNRIFTQFPALCITWLHKYKLISIQYRSRWIFSSAGCCIQLFFHTCREKFHCCHQYFFCIGISTASFPSLVVCPRQNYKYLIILMS